MTNIMFISSLVLLSFAFTTSFSLQNPRFPTNVAEKMIRELNLFPERSVNVLEDEVDVLRSSSDGEKKLVERRFKFPGFDDPNGATVEDLGHHAGYYRIEHSIDARMFYFFFESRGQKTDPVVIWLTGGPGCSSEVALFEENGPFKVQKNLSLVWNDYGWDQASNILFVDQPTGTGFSYTSDRRDIRHDEQGVSSDLYDFLQAFFKEHPDYANNDYFITGESYAGHYIPAFATKVHEENKASNGIHINLKGFAIGNGLTDPLIQYKAYTDYALDMKLIKEYDRDRINKLLPECEEAVKLCATNGTTACWDAYLSCNNIFSSIKAVIGNINHYDIRKQCVGPLCYDFSDMEHFLKLESVKEALGVKDIDFVTCSAVVYNAMLTDWMRNYEVGIPRLLEDGIKMLVYAGEYDLICNWLGNSRWVHAMEWSGQKEFVASPDIPFVVDGSNAGSLKTYGPLAFLKVRDAGHMVPMDQPKAALSMLKRWTTGSLSESAAEPESPVSSM
ncbi:serine carboxypeptidase-like [Bidens hawaiensis]|uniref:serine carboxypeptidase-like n=1 Tax=Bidens hawaiensis TaxID=980011 RepID=UPI00404B9013